LVKHFFFTNFVVACLCRYAEFCAIVAELQSRFAERVYWCRATRLARCKAALEDGVMPGPLPPSIATTSEWTVPPLPRELRQPGIEISGPAS
jgi:hypothetical protein